MIETPQSVLNYWIGKTKDSAEAMAAQNKLWFVKSFATDTEIATRYIDTMAALASGLAHDWAKDGPHERLAAIIALDQFSRNVFRDTPDAFANDALAVKLCKQGLAVEEDKDLSEVERQFFYLPLEHSEATDDQALSIAMYEKLASDARPDFAGGMKGALDYAKKHKDVIDRFGRYPHRNAILGRSSTPEEDAYLAEPGSGF